MNHPDNQLDRLLRCAAEARADAPPAAPFGFDTRIVALWRAGQGSPGNGVSRLLGRVAILSAAVLVISTVAAVRELRQSRDVGDSITNEFAIADTAIQSEFSK